MEDIKKLVMVDDDADLEALLKLKLEKTGKYEVATTTEASKTIDLVREVSPDLILLDIDMPEMTGGDVANVLSESKDTKDIPILFLSSLVSRSGRNSPRFTVHGANLPAARARHNALFPLNATGRPNR